MFVKLSHSNEAEHYRVERLCYVLSAVLKRYDQWSAWPSVVELHDHEGLLQVSSDVCPNLKLMEVLREVWAREGRENEEQVEFLSLSGVEWGPGAVEDGDVA